MKINLIFSILKIQEGKDKLKELKKRLEISKEQRKRI
jgi:hypothetical protein